jgi:TetR/AcrR family transcriptional regulator
LERNKRLSSFIHASSRFLGPLRKFLPLAVDQQTLGLTFSPTYLPFGKLMARPSVQSAPDTRQQILQAALRLFAHSGYAGASVQAIVDAAKVTKPVLYYHFGNKEGLYSALIEWAADERLRRSQEAADRGKTLEEKFIEILATTFEFVRENRELTRLSIGTAFAAKGEVPNQGQCMTKGRQVFDMMMDLAEGARREGVLKKEFSAQELTMAVYGVMNFHVMIHLVMPEPELTRSLSERIVKLFLSGGAPEGGARGSGRKSGRSRKPTKSA